MTFAKEDGIQPPNRDKSVGNQLAKVFGLLDKVVLEFHVLLNLRLSYPLTHYLNLGVALFWFGC